MIRIIFALFALLCAQALHADYQDGLDAYSKGYYRAAMEEWMAVVEAPASDVNPRIYAESHYAIAKLYWEGSGTPRDYYRSREWLEKAATLGHEGAMAKLGYLYTDGISVQQDFGEAFRWYQEAARLGDVDGLYNLGIFYLNGWGTEPDRVMAKQYLAAASAQGDSTAEEALQQVMAMEPLAPVKKVENQPGLEVNTEVLSQTESEPPAAELLIRDEDWILSRNPAHYTIQAIGLSDLHKLVGLAEAHESLAPFATYTVQRDSKPIHLLIQGAYPSVEEARAARDRFPRGINRPDKVWIRQFGKIQELIRRDRGL
jgi:hypothetical protein